MARASVDCRVRAAVRGGALKAVSSMAKDEARELGARAEQAEGRAKIAEAARNKYHKELLAERQARLRALSQLEKRSSETRSALQGESARRRQAEEKGDKATALAEAAAAEAEDLKRRLSASESQRAAESAAAATAAETLQRDLDSARKRCEEAESTLSETASEAQKRQAEAIDAAAREAEARVQSLRSEAAEAAAAADREIAQLRADADGLRARVASVETELAAAATD
eukprot:3756044-Pleurochrysis_carterae.AAC.1